MTPSVNNFHQRRRVGGTFAVSDYSNVVSLDDYREPSTSVIESRREKLFEQLIDVAAEAKEDGKTFVLKSFTKAIQFASKLDYAIDSPEAGIESDGKALLEWARREMSGKLSMFSIVFDDDDFVFSALIDGVPGIRGTLCYHDESRIALEGFIKSNFISIRHDQSSAV